MALFSSGFILLFAASLTLAPAVQARSWQVDLRWSHWPVTLGWFLVAGGFLYFLKKFRTITDPILIPITLLLAGWGLHTIARISPRMGYKQTLWLILASVALFTAIPFTAKMLALLRKYKYLWLAGGIVLTALTLIFGTNPNGYGPRLWFGCCGVYFQPSEPLKILLILYLSAYFADRQPFSTRLLPLLLPTLLITGLACLILIIQRDLGTASILLIIYAGMIYTATGKKRLLILSLLGILLAALLGYYFFDVVQVRFEAWLNPWLDPSGDSYQIVQSLIAIAAGGMTGRGPGLGYPNLVPISFSDFIFSAIAEEFGLPGTVGLILALMILSFRGLNVGLRAPDKHMRYIAVGISIYLGAQSILIIGGNIRLMPLTGVTLPFLSYGGSSLLTSMFALFLLIAIQNAPIGEQTIYPATPIINLAAILTAGFVSLAILNSWWSLWRGPDLLTRIDNARRMTSDTAVHRGSILDRNQLLLSHSTGISGTYSRQYPNPDIAHPVGYTHPFYGQAGAELSLDPILRGLENQHPWTIWINHLIYGQSPPGLDAQVSLDSTMQTLAADLMGDQVGAAVLLNAQTGEILVLYSSPTFNPAQLDTTWEQLLADPDAPLLNRATQGLYPPGPSLAPFLITETNSYGQLPPTLDKFSIQVEGMLLDCTAAPSQSPTWEEITKSGCPLPLSALGLELGETGLTDLFSNLGFYQPPNIRLETSPPYIPEGISTPGVTAYGQADILITPLQMAVAASTLTNHGIRTTPKFLLKAQLPDSGWIENPADQEEIRVFLPTLAERTITQLAHQSLPFWEAAAYAITGTGADLTWYLAGSIPTRTVIDEDYSVVVLLETKNAELAEKIGRQLLIRVLYP
ncbi:MAG: FtsW/RodA/SpoVE family cell cycle protein [Anaerolineales bacterium]|nr:FtsW/RodA/SpoVE family cell cycle protein [Anaerolineales bacterium]